MTVLKEPEEYWFTATFDFEAKAKTPEEAADLIIKAVTETGIEVDRLVRSDGVELWNDGNGNFTSDEEGE